MQERQFTDADPRVRIGSIPVETPKIGLGTYHLTDKVTGIVDLAEVFIKAQEAGITLLDTSDNYGTEVLIGALVSRNFISRDDTIIATKTGLGTTYEEQQQWYADGRPYNTDPERVRRQVEQSRELLGVETIDLYQLHVYDPQVPVDEHVELMTELKDEGVIREYGLSNYSYEELKEFLDACDTLELPRPAAVQPFYNMLSVDTFRSVQLAREQGITVLAHSPLLRGALTVKHLPTLRNAANRSTVMNADDPEFTTFITKIDTVIENLDVISDIAQSRGRNIAQVALGWLCEQEGVVALNSAVNPHYLDNAIAASRWPVMQDYEISRIIERMHNDPESLLLFRRSTWDLMRQIRMAQTY